MNLEQFLAALRFHFGLTESVNTADSYEALRRALGDALQKWFGRPAQHMGILHTFADRVIAYAWDSDDSMQAWEIPYTPGEGGDFAFGQPVRVEKVVRYEDMTESKDAKQGRFNEIVPQAIELQEATGDGARRVRAIGITADVVNGNGRRYPRAVLADAISRLHGTLKESAGQGRMIELTGEAEHPSDKGQKPNILETVVRWDAVSLDASGMARLEGAIIPTSKGKDLNIILESGVRPGISIRGYGSYTTIQESGQSIDEVTHLTITGWDIVTNASDPNGRISESQQSNHEDNNKMGLEELLKLLAEKPELLEAIQKRLGLTSAAQIAEAFNTEPGKLTEAISAATAAQAELAERKNREAVNTAIDEACKELPYGDMNQHFVEAVRNAQPADAAAVKPIIEAKRKEWDTLFSNAKLASMGRKSGGNGVKVLGPVFERETGRPEYTRPAFELTESMINAGEARRRKLEDDDAPRAHRFTERYLKMFDEQYKAQLIQEAKLFEEAEQTSDLNLPYSVSRAIVEEAYPELVAANVFDFGIASQAPERLYFEFYAGETGSTAAITDEAVTGDHGVWVSLANKRIQPGTVVLTNSGASTTYVEGTDYVMDYGNGRIMTLAAGATTDGQSLLIDYTYDAIRKGENASIERMKSTLSYITLEIAADRLATQITDEAIVFSRSQLGYDAVGRTLFQLVRKIRRKIDKDILYRAIAAATLQASNSGGTWASGSDAVAEFVEKLGVAKVKVENRFYMANSILMSKTNADRLSNWDGFKRDGFPNAVLNAAGFAGSVKGLPIFASPEMSDAYAVVANRELVQHRVFQAMQLRGPYPVYSSGEMVAAEEYYAQEYNGTDTPVVQKGAYVKIS